MPIDTLSARSEIVISERVVLASHSRFTALGVGRPCILRTLLPGAKITIGKDTGMSGVSVCAAVSVKIGAQCLLGADVLVADTDFHPLAEENRRFAKTKEASASPVVIGDNVFVGARSIILKGITIGDGAVIGAGSVVVSDIPPGSVAAVFPARVLRRVS